MDEFVIVLGSSYATFVATPLIALFFNKHLTRYDTHLFIITGLFTAIFVISLTTKISFFHSIYALV